jgi:hypothetical protein
LDGERQGAANVNFLAGMSAGVSGGRVGDEMLQRS